MGSKLTDEQRSQRYVAQEGMNCPSCQSNGFGREFDKMDGWKVSRRCHCYVCNTDWVEHATITGITEIKEGE